MFTGLGFDTLGDEVFRDLVIARVVEPTSILDTGRVFDRPGSYAGQREDHAPHADPRLHERLS